jgi:hypothetical protein
MPLSYCVVGGIVHDKEGSTAGILDAKVENGNNVWMFQTEVACFVEEGGYLFVRETDIENFDGDLNLAVDVLGKVDVAEMSLSSATQLFGKPWEAKDGHDFIMV